MGSSNETPNTAAVSETELREKRVDELRKLAGEAGVTATSKLRKDELVDAIVEVRTEGGRSTGGGGADEGGAARIGDHTSKSVRYSQEITSTGEDPERPGRSLVTTNHDVIRTWAEARGATPATVEGTEHGDHLGVLRFVFRGNDTDRFREVDWEEWFSTFDDRQLNFIYQEERSDGFQSNFFRLENPDREDA